MAITDVANIRYRNKLEKIFFNNFLLAKILTEAPDSVDTFNELIKLKLWQGTILLSEISGLNPINLMEFNSILTQNSFFIQKGNNHKQTFHSSYRGFYLVSLGLEVDISSESLVNFHFRKYCEFSDDIMLSIL